MVEHNEFVLLLWDTAALCARRVYLPVNNGHLFALDAQNAPQPQMVEGASVENDQRAYYTAGGRVWVMDLEVADGKKPRMPGTGKN